MVIIHGRTICLHQEFQRDDVVGRKACFVKTDRLILGDCIQTLNSLDAGWADLAIADPPYNIGYKYDVYVDRLEDDEYLEWTRAWILATVRSLKPDGTFWIAIGDEYAAEVKRVAESCGLHMRNWVIWYYTFGVHCTTKFTRSHTHLLYFVKDPKRFTFNADEIRVPSARQLVYNDKRANSVGRVPDNTWVLRPQDIGDGGFLPDHDTMYVPRIAGTFKERAQFHGCQLPEQLLGRIVRACSDPEEIVIDPFSGTGSTLVTAKKLGRHWLGVELSEDYGQFSCDRLDEVRTGDPLNGGEEPTTSAPRTTIDRQKNLRRPQGIDETALIDAFANLKGSPTIDRMVADPFLNAEFIDNCSTRQIPGRPADWCRVLMNLRRSGNYPELKRQGGSRDRMDWKNADAFEFACEMGLRRMLDEGYRSLDDVLCDPEAAMRFDRYCRAVCPGRTSFEYRWVAMKLRKSVDQWGSTSAGDSPLDQAESLDIIRCPPGPCVYVVLARNELPAFVGFTHNMEERLEATKLALDGIRDWIPNNGEWLIRTSEVRPDEGRSRQRAFVNDLRPRLNFLVKNSSS